MSDERGEHIRKEVGGGDNDTGPDATEKSPAQRLWDLRARMIRLGIDFGNDNERIRKIVGRPRDR